MYSSVALNTFIKLWHTQSKEVGAELERSRGFYILLKVSWYKFKLVYYIFRILKVIPMVTTKKIRYINRIYTKGNENLNI